MQLYAEVDEDDKADATDILIDHATHGNSIVDTMSHEGNEEDADGDLRRAVDKVVDGVVIAHEDGKGIMARDGQQGTGGGNSHPVVLLLQQIEQVLDGCKAQADADGIDDAVEMLVEIGILA